MNYNNVNNIALIGYGYWGKILYKYLTEMKIFNTKYIYYNSLNNLDQQYIIDEYGPQFINSISTIWDDSSINNVIIATPIKTHYKLVLEALSMSKNVFVEKPLTVNLSESITLKEKAKINNCFLMTDYTYTFSESLKFIQQFISKGLVGDIKSIYISFKQFGRFIGYDVYTLLGSHALSILDMFLPLKDCFYESHSKINIDHIVTDGLITFKSKNNSCIGNIDLSLLSPDKEKKVIIYCDKGTIVYDQYDDYSVKIYVFSKKVTRFNNIDIKDEYKFAYDEKNNVKYALESFHAILNHNNKDNIDLAIDIDKILESLRT